MEPICKQVGPRGEAGPREALSKAPDQGDTVEAFEVGGDFDRQARVVAGNGGADQRGLIAADLDGGRAAGHHAHLIDEPSVEVETVVAAVKRGTRFVIADFGLQGVDDRPRDVGQVGDQQAGGRAGRGLEVGDDGVDPAGQVESLDVLVGDTGGGDGDLAGDDRGFGKFAGQAPASTIMAGSFGPGAGGFSRHHTSARSTRHSVAGRGIKTLASTRRSRP
jgi:hypothetical protein